VVVQGAQVGHDGLVGHVKAGELVGHVASVGQLGHVTSVGQVDNSGDEVVQGWHGSSGREMCTTVRAENPLAVSVACKM